jgi:hypothetical protein
MFDHAATAVEAALEAGAVYADARSVSENLGLRDGLTVSDGQKVIFVGLVEIIGGHELMAGNSPHRPQDQWVLTSRASIWESTMASRSCA